MVTACPHTALYAFTVPIKITTINAKGLYSPQKRNMLWKEAILQKIYILCMQETHFLNIKPPKRHHIAFLHYFFANADKKCKGVMIAICNTLSLQLLQVGSDPNCRFLILSAIIDNQNHTIVNLYAPNTHQTKFYTRLMHKILPHKDKKNS